MTEDLTKHLYVENVEEWQKKLSAKSFSDGHPSVQTVERGIFLPAHEIETGYEGGVCDSDFNFVAGYTRRVPPQKPKGNVEYCDLLTSYAVDRENIVQLDEDVIFGGALRGHFGHFMLEGFCRLWYVIQHPELKQKILFLPYRGRHRPWFDEFFRLMGLEKERIIYVDDKPIQCRSITIPEQSCYAPSMFMKEFLTPYQAIKEHVTPSEYKKIYFTRTSYDAPQKSLNQAHCFNEKYFEDFFESRGFKIVAPEKLSIEEQISLVMGADEIASTMGTLTHWALFCKPTAKFIMFPRTHTTHLLHFQFFINAAINLKDLYIVDVSKSPLQPYSHYGACMLGSTKYWKEFVADYFGEQIDEDDDSPHFGVALDTYTDFWCRKYVGAESENFDTVLNSLKDICNRIVTLERERIKYRPVLTYQTHAAKDGWSAWMLENQISNSLDQNHDIQAIKINFSKPFYGIFYSVYYNEQEGWSQEVCNGEQAGTTGKRKPITGIKIRLDEAGASVFDLLYRVHTFDDEWTAWAKNGEELLSQGVNLNAIQIRLASK